MKLIVDIAVHLLWMVCFVTVSIYSVNLINFSLTQHFLSEAKAARMECINQIGPSNGCDQIYEEYMTK